MANLDAAKKAQRSSKRKKRYNAKRTSRIERITKKTLKLIEMGETKLAQEQLPKVYKAVDKAAKKGTIHPNKAARIKSSLTDKVSNAPKKKTTKKKATKKAATKKKKK